MYNVQVDENMFFTGSYAKVGKVTNGIDVDKLPPTENSLCYKLVDMDWEFSQERYYELEAERVAKEEDIIKEQEYQNSISNETLASRLLELENSTSMELMVEAILKGVDEI